MGSHTEASLCTEYAIPYPTQAIPQAVIPGQVTWVVILKSRLDPLGRLLALMVRALPLPLSLFLPKVRSTHHRRLDVQRAGEKIAVASRTAKVPFRIE